MKNSGLVRRAMVAAFLVLVVVSVFGSQLAFAQTTWRMLRTDVEDSSLAMNGESGRVLQEWR